MPTALQLLNANETEQLYSVRAEVMYMCYNPDSMAEASALSLLGHVMKSLVNGTHCFIYSVTIGDSITVMKTM